MIYATTAFWLLIIMLLAWGVHHVWGTILKPRTVNTILLPGTLVAQLGHVLGLLITGAKVSDAALMGDDDKGDPEMTANPQPKIPVVGPVIVGLLPMVTLGLGVYLVAVNLGLPVLMQAPTDRVARQLPETLDGFWDQLRDLITLSEGTLDAVMSAGVTPDWHIVAFCYLMICLTVRMAPWPGNVRGHVGAIATLGVMGVIVGSVRPDLPDIIVTFWPILGLTLGWLLLLMMATLFVRGGLTTVRMILQLEKGR